VVGAGERRVQDALAAEFEVIHPLQDKAFRTGIRKTDLDVGTLPPKADARQCLGESQRLREAPRVSHHVQELAYHLRREGKTPQTRSTRLLHGSAHRHVASNFM
jgi:hypothetical protein